MNLKKTSWLPIIVLLVLLVLINQQKLFKQSAQEAPESVIKKAEPIKNLQERKTDGPVLMYYENGQLKAERVYKNAKLNGIYRTYYDNGQMKIDGVYQDDKMEGVFRHYNRNGQLEAEEVYQDNILISRKYFTTQ